MDYKLVDNKGDNTLVNIIKEKIEKNSRIAIASSYFSIYAYEALQNSLENLNEIRFLYTSSFIEKESNNLVLEENPFEYILRNKMNSKILAKKMADWIQKNAIFKAIQPEHFFTKQLLVQNDDKDDFHIQSEVEFTADGLGVTTSNRLASYPVITEKNGLTKLLMQEFDRIWNDEKKVTDITSKLLENLHSIYRENSPEWIYFVTLYNIFSEEIESLSEENILKEGTNFKDTIIWNKLYSYQRDGVIGMIDKIEKYNGCILADSVGLGKTFSALAVIKYYELRNDRVLVLCPKKLRDNWAVYTQNDKRNILSEDRFNYDVLNHTDLTRENGFSGEIRLDTINWSNYDLVVIDESHNFRNNVARKGRLTRYQKLMQDIIKKGVKTKVLLLSATPVNNKMNDIKNQIAFITEDKDNALEKEGIESIEQTLRAAQASFNKWINMPNNQKTTDSFLELVNQDYFHLLDLLSIARSRQHIEKYYNINEIGMFPTRLKPISVKTDIAPNGVFLKIQEINELLESLNFSIYQPMQYVLPQKRQKYEMVYDTTVKNGKSVFKQIDREFAVAALMKVNLFKRLESAVYSFKLTLQKLILRIENTLELLSLHKVNMIVNDYEEIVDFDDEQLESITVGSDKVQIDLKDIDALKWQSDLKADLAILKKLLNQADKVDVSKDEKLRKLKEIITHKVHSPINPGNKKIIIFSAFADTIKYLYDKLSGKLLNLGLHSALVIGSGSNKTTLKGVRVNDLNDILMNFSPNSKERDKISPDKSEEIDILFATDCISEGQNLQDCDYLINYDIHWNPVRVVQRFGRIDRIGSKNRRIQLVNFWPKMDLDEYINLEDRVKGRMKILSTSASGEEDIFDSSKQMNDLEYRRNQLKALQNEIINLEDVTGAISITDLNYTDFRSDLSNALKKYKKDLEKSIKGSYAIVSNENFTEAKPGIIFCFKQRIKTDMENNGIYPHVLVYITSGGEAFMHYAQTKNILDFYRKLTLGNDKPIAHLVELFNKETKYGENMTKYQELMRQAVDLIKNKKEETFFDSFFTVGGTSIQTNMEFVMEDFELISFLIIEGDR